MSMVSTLLAHPVVRGFWTDEEMMAITGATSLAPIKRLQKAELVSPGRYEKAPGKKARAWELDDILTIALSLELAEHASLNLAVTSIILSAIGRSLVTKIVLGKEIMAAAAQVLESHSPDTHWGKDGLPSGWHNRNLDIKRDAFADLIIQDRKQVFIRHSQGGLASTKQVHFVASFESMKSNEPNYSLINVKRHALIGETEEVSRLVIHLNRLLSASVMSKAVGANVCLVEPEPK